MKITYPYMGCVTGYKKLLSLLGHEVIPPLRPTQHTFDLGVLHSPEFICYPFKVMMGTYIEACEKGAEVIISSGGDGPCRAGLYGAVHASTLKKLGYNVDVIIFDSMFRSPGLFLKNLLKIKNGTPLWRVIKYVRLSLKMIKQMDEIEKYIKLKRPYEREDGAFNSCFNKITAMYDACCSLGELKRTHEKAWELIKAVETDEVPQSERMRIGIVGEIFVIMESATNMNIEQRLNSLGAEVENVQYISDWVGHYLPPAPFNRSKSRKVCEKGKRYKKFNCGGHDMENTGWIIDFAERGFDGVVHIQPFGCLPELITRSIIPKMSEELDIPILSISIDEQTGEANTQTRLEAFVDLCRSKRKGGNKRQSVAAYGKE